MATTIQLEHPVRAPAGTGAVDAAGLEADLKSVVHGEVRFSDGDRGLWAADGSNYRQVPIGAVLPRSIDDVIETVRLCRERGAPLLARGGGTSLAGQCCNVAVVVDFSKYMHHVLEVDPHRRTARVQPGAVLDDLRDEAEKHRLTFGPDPATHKYCTLGGMIGNNSCGPHSVMAGKTVDNVERLDVITYDGVRMQVGPTSEEQLDQITRQGGRRGEIYGKLRDIRDRYAEQIRARYPQIPRRVSGYNLDQLLPENGFHVARALVGSESTCVTILEATVRLVPSPAHRTLLVLGYPDVFAAGDDVPEVMRHNPIALEGIDHSLVEFMRTKKLHPDKIGRLPEGRGWLLVEFGADTLEESRRRAEEAQAALAARGGIDGVVYVERDKQHDVWDIRESGLGATAYVPGHPDTWPGWEDSAVPPDRLGDYLRDLRHLLDKHGYECSLYGHFGQGCIHTRIDFDLKTSQGIQTYRRLAEEAADLVQRYHGSFSGEHGDGQARSELLPRMFGEELMRAFREFKAAWDPDWKMNPGKVIDAYRLDENLRLGSDYRPPHVETHFHYPEDHGSFAHATLRCVGVGKCRRSEGGTMCPSYMVTREEKHTTRGRAHLLFEMLQGDPVRDLWKNDDVRDALDLCLACKGCKGDCPVNVDLATYKAEFLSHYYQGRLRPRHAYSTGLIYWWARMASMVPDMVNFVSQTPLLRDLAKWAGGIAPQRSLPKFARQTFKDWFFKRQPRNPTGPKVLLWPDTFNNFFQPRVAQAAVEVLETAGYHVLVPRKSLCCGRPLYDFGMLNLAKSLLVQIVDALGPEIEEGIPIVGLEPSCVAVFRDEAPNLFPFDEHIKRLAQNSFLFSEFLASRAKDYHPPKLHRKAMVHQHCHHKAVLGKEEESRLLADMEVDCEVLDSGCCGMAGSFGYEEGHYEVSMAVGERVLLPAVRQAPKDTLLIADGFSCRSQIAEATDRQALHPAQVLQMAVREGPDGPPADFPERRYGASRLEAESPSHPLQTSLLVGAGALAIGGILTWIAKKWNS